MSKALEKYKELTRILYERRAHDVLFTEKEENKLLDEMDILLYKLAPEEITEIEK